MQMERRKKGILNGVMSRVREREREEQEKEKEKERRSKRKLNRIGGKRERVSLESDMGKEWGARLGIRYGREHYGHQPIFL
jgi:hypothetical protein